MLASPRGLQGKLSSLELGLPVFQLTHLSQSYLKGGGRVQEHGLLWDPLWLQERRNVITQDNYMEEAL